VIQDSDPLGRTTDSGTSETPSDTFDLVWAALVEILGSPATAILLRRSARQRQGEYPQLEELTITRKSFEYAYTVPADWKHANEPSTAALQALLRDLCSLLLELTGPVVVNRLRALPQLAKCGLAPSEGEL